MLILLFIPVSGYTEENGVELGDVVVVSYIGTTTEDGVTTEFDSTEEARFTISYDNLIEGFVDGILGMKVGEQKTIVVPPEKGYTTPGHQLYDKTLYFDLTLISVVGFPEFTEEPFDSVLDDSTPELTINFPTLLFSLFGLFAIVKTKKKYV